MPSTISYTKDDVATSETKKYERTNAVLRPFTKKGRDSGVRWFKVPHINNKSY